MAHAVVRLQTKSTPQKPAKKPEAHHDPLFFVKAQIKVGVTLEYFGRRDPGSLWDVNRITTDEPGTTKSKSVNTVHRLHDIVHLTRRGSNSDKHQASFGYLSYSAIWRLPRGSNGR